MDSTPEHDAQAWTAAAVGAALALASLWNDPFTGPRTVSTTALYLAYVGLFVAVGRYRDWARRLFLLQAALTLPFAPLLLMPQPNIGYDRAGWIEFAGVAYEIVICALLLAPGIRRRFTEAPARVLQRVLVAAAALFVSVPFAAFGAVLFLSVEKADGGSVVLAPKARAFLLPMAQRSLGAPLPDTGIMLPYKPGAAIVLDEGLKQAAYVFGPGMEWSEQDGGMLAAPTGRGQVQLGGKANDAFKALVAYRRPGAAKSEDYIVVVTAEPGKLDEAKAKRFISEFEAGLGR